MQDEVICLSLRSDDDKYTLMKRKIQPIILLFALLLLPALRAAGQQAVRTGGEADGATLVLTLDSCRTLALSGGKRMEMVRTEQEQAAWQQRAARTNYLPKVSLTAGYMRTGDQISLLSADQKQTLSSLGTALAGQAGAAFRQMAGQLLAANPELAPLVQGLSASMAGAPEALAGALNAAGQQVVDAFHTDTRNMGAAALLLAQPLYTGGKIRAYDRLTRYAQAVAAEKLRAEAHAVVVDVDQAYWQVVQLSEKRRLCESYVAMLRRLDSDVQAMIRQGVATRQNELTVGVKLGEAELTLSKVDDGLRLSRMLLCQLCSLPLDTPLRLRDEGGADAQPPAYTPEAASLGLRLTQADTTEVLPQTALALNQRPELRQLDYAANIYGEKTRIERSAQLPQLSLVGGYLTTYPSLKNGFERRVRGTWQVGVMLSVPVWNWGELRYKTRAARAEERVARLRLSDTRERVELQVSQQALRVNQQVRQLRLARRNIARAEENLRVARLGFAEGVVTTSDLLAAQTAWLSAHSDVIDAQAQLLVARSVYRQALGTDAPCPTPGS